MNALNPRPGPLPNDLQLTEDGQLRHLLDVEGLGRPLLEQILDNAESFAGLNDQGVKKVPLLRGKTVVNLFFEPSTRTRTTFEMAAKRLSADVINLNMSASSTTKGETLLDTLRNLEAMQCDMFIVRHAQAGAAHFIARHVAPQYRGDQRRRRPPRASHPGAARHVHHPPLQGRAVTVCALPSSATCCTRAWRARKSTRSTPWAPGRCA